LGEGQFLLSYYLYSFFSQLTLACLCVCVWRWSRDLLRGSRREFRWSCWCLATERGYRWGIFFMLCFPTFCNRHYDLLSIMMFEISRAWEFIEMSDFLKVYFVKNQFYLVISIWGVITTSASIRWIWLIICIRMSHVLSLSVSFASHNMIGWHMHFGSCYCK